MSAKRTVTAAALALAVASALTLTSCASPESLVRGAVEQVSGGEVKLGEPGKMPAGVPDEVPVLDGDITAGAAVGASGGGWMVAVKVTRDPQSALTAAETALKDAGFTGQGTGTLNGLGGALYRNDRFSVLVSSATDKDATIVTYVVTPT